jgi:hypothetical protein
MRKLAVLFTAVAMLTSFGVQAQTTGHGAAASTTSASDTGMAWGIGLAAVAVIGTVVGVVAASATHSQSFAAH